MESPGTITPVEPPSLYSLEDPSHGWDAVADQFMEVRSPVGASVVLEWARSLTAGAIVLDVGCGHGAPITDALVEAGCSVYALDASPRMVAAFSERHSTIPVACEAIETSPCFHRTFNGVVAIGVLFLLPPTVQPLVLHRLASLLTPHGHLLFTAPREACTWTDSLTGRQSVSLGVDAYRELLHASGLRVVDVMRDEGGNDYIAAVR